MASALALFTSSKQLQAKFLAGQTMRTAVENLRAGWYGDGKEKSLEAEELHGPLDDWGPAKVKALVNPVRTLWAL